MKTKLRPHKVLSKVEVGGDLYALSFTEGQFADIVFSYTNVNFEENEEQDHLKIKFEYNIHYVPEDKIGFDTKVLEKELGDFVVELLMYGLEIENLGFVNDNETRENDSLKPDPQ